MSRRWRGGTVGRVARAVRHRTDAVDRTLLASARGDRFVEAALAQAGRNMGVAIALLPEDLYRVAAASFLAFRALDAFEDLGDDPVRRAAAVREAAGYLAGATMMPPRLAGEATRDSEEVDAALAGRLVVLRRLVVALPLERRRALEALVAEVGEAMAENLVEPKDRMLYASQVLGRISVFACDTLTGGPAVPPAVASSAAGIAQIANDLRDDELAAHGSASRVELEVTVMTDLPPRLLAVIELVRELDSSVTSRRAFAALLHLMLTTARSVTSQLGIEPPVPPGHELLHAVWAASTRRGLDDLVRRLRDSANRGVERLHRELRGTDDVEPWPDMFGETVAESASASGPRAAAPLARIVGRRGVSVLDALPERRLEGPSSDPVVGAIMMADHLLFSAIEQCAVDEPGELSAVFSELAEDLRRTSAGASFRRVEPRPADAERRRAPGPRFVRA